MTDTSKPTAVPAPGETSTGGYRQDAVEAKWQARWAERHTNEPTWTVSQAFALARRSLTG